MNFKNLKNRFMNSFRRFMFGRNGIDQLSVVLMLSSVLLMIVSCLLKSSLFSVVAYLPAVFGLFRAYSKNLTARRQENRAFRRTLKKIKDAASLLFCMVRDVKTHRYFRCPSCGQWLRVPKGRGTIDVTCTKCKTHTIKKV